MRVALDCLVRFVLAPLLLSACLASFAQAQQWIESKSQEPFYLFVHTYQVHAPFRPPPLYGQLFRDDGLDERLVPVSEVPCVDERITSRVA